MLQLLIFLFVLLLGGPSCIMVQCQLIQQPEYPPTNITRSNNLLNNTRTLGHAQADVRLWNTNYQNGYSKIYVQISNQYKEASQKQIRKGFKDVEKRSKVVKFQISSSKPSNKQQPYIRVQPTGEGCWSWIGQTSKATNGQILSLDDVGGCINPGVIQHEILHALGLIHEHTRQDRNEYVSITFNNIKEDKKDNFWKDGNGDTLETEYDLGSVMHYGKDTATKNGKPVMKAKVSDICLKTHGLQPFLIDTHESTYFFKIEWRGHWHCKTSKLR